MSARAMGFAGSVEQQGYAMQQASGVGHLSGGPTQHTRYPVVTGSTVLAIKYNGGVMMLADTLASFGKLHRYKDIQRLQKVNDHTLLGAGGEISDFQFILRLLRELSIEDFNQDDGANKTPAEIWSYLARVLYNRRTKVNPLWNELVVGGFRDGEAFLGYVDMYGSNYQENILATGYGTYLAVPLLRKSWKPDLTEEEAKALLEKAMKVCLYRDCKTINSFQISKVDKDGVEVSKAYQLTDLSWGFKRFVDPSYQES